jgi:sugar O-acyltransferase (sialic acid O-acetyltransferase NeuD family)
MASDFVIWGSSGHGKVLVELLHMLSYDVTAVFDRDPAAVSVVPGMNVITGEDAFRDWARERASKSPCFGALGMGGKTGTARLHIMSIFASAGISCPPLVHPRAMVSTSARLAAGTHVLAGAVIGPDTTVGEAGIVNHGAIVDHECKLGRGVHIAPGATLCGCVKTGDDVMIGAGAVVLPRVTIGTNVMIGAGAVVTADVSSGDTVAGVPARSILKS